MTTSTQSLSSEELREATHLIAQIQKSLNLSHWRIYVTKQQPANGNLFEIVTNRLRNSASVRISRAGWEDPGRNRLLIHELLHIVLDPIREEHDIQMAHLQTERKREYCERHTREIERAVEHLSYVLDSN